MDFDFQLPEIGEGLVEGEIVKWFVKEGDSVKENDPLVAVLTDKAEVEIPSPRSGIVSKLHATPGQKVKVHSPLVSFSNVEESFSSKPTKEAVRNAGPLQSKTAKTSSSVRASPKVRKMAQDVGLNLAQIPGSGPEGRILESDLGASRPATASLKATPAVRALASQLGVDLARAQATGPGGRIVESDVRAAASAPKSTISEEERVPFVGIRRKIAEKMTLSKRTIADVTHVDECEMTALLALREELKPEADRRGVKLTFLPFIITALAKTLREFPNFNASLDEAAGELVIKRSHNIGIAVSAPQGLLVPNIKGADAKGLWELAAEVSTLAEQVRANKIDVASLQGGTFTITNIGPLGGLYANPIVNHPEVAILALMKMQKRPVVRDGKVVARDVMNLCLTFDHRVVDGADAARFMNALILRLENPRTLLSETA